jgi:ABC-2 type transport system permease protein
MIVALVLAVPPIWVAASAISAVSFGMNFWALIFGAGYGLVVVTVGVLIGGRVFDRAAPELLALTQTFD